MEEADFKVVFFYNFEQNSDNLKIMLWFTPTKYVYYGCVGKV